ncbi:MAG: hypothetical protein WAN48_10875 [Actinomycetes bacterium]
MTNGSHGCVSRRDGRTVSSQRARRVVMLVGAVGLAVAVAGCGSAASPAARSTTPSPASSTVGGTQAGLTTSKTPLGTILVDSQGRTIYMFAADRSGHSVCVGSCLTYWPIVPAPAGAQKPNASGAATIGSITRPDGAHQLTVNGWPVYTYVGDSSPGMTSGQGLNSSGGLWWVLAPDGVPIKASNGTTPSSGPSTSPPTYGY